LVFFLGRPPAVDAHRRDCGWLAEQAAQQPREHHRQAVVAGTPLGSPLDIFERPHAVADDAQVMLPRDLALSLADAEQLAEAGSPRAREELESGHEISPVREPTACGLISR